MNGITDGKIATDAATFTNQQAIVKFTLKEQDNNSACKVSSLIVKAGEATTIEVTPASATNELFVALPAIDGAPISLQATAKDDTYRGYFKAAATFAKGQYYEIGVKMSRALHVKNESELRTVLGNDAYNGYTIIVDNDIILSNFVEIPSGKAFTFDLGGHTLSRNLASADNDGNILYVNGGTLSVNNGSLTGGWDNWGGAVEISASGVFHAADVTFSGNKAAEYGGTIWNKGTATLTNCTISGNEAPDGPGIWNVAGAAMTINGGTISGNNATRYGSGGICNHGTLTMTDVNVIDNTTADGQGGGIWNDGTLTISGGIVSGNNAVRQGGGIYSNGTLVMSGNPVVSGNTGSGNSVSNLYLASGKVITVSGAFTDGASIYVTTADGTRAFTSNYTTNNPGKEPDKVFFADNSNLFITNSGGEATLTNSAPQIPDGPIKYRNVNEDGEYLGMETLAEGSWNRLSTKADTESDLTLTSGWYVVDLDCTFSSRITLAPGATVNLLLADNMTLNANNGICLPDSKSTLYIWSQSDELSPIIGRLNANSIEWSYPGIGGVGSSGGYLQFRGGYIEAHGAKSAAGIQGNADDIANTFGIVISGGIVVGYGGKGDPDTDLKGGGAGIGGNPIAVCCSIKITGGAAWGWAGEGAAGIGTGWRGTMHDRSGLSYNPSTDDRSRFIMTGGEASGFGYLGAGIGGGIALDIYEGGGFEVTISGGFVHAVAVDGIPAGNGNKGAMAIGSGDCQGDAQHPGILTYVFQPTIYSGAIIEASTSSMEGCVAISHEVWYKNWETYKEVYIRPAN